MSALEIPAAWAISSSEAPWYPRAAKTSSAAARIASRRLAAGMRRRGAGAAIASILTTGTPLGLRAVDAQIDFEAAGLLDGLEGEARAARLELLERLAADGWELDELRAASADGRLLFLQAERVVGGEPRYSARDIAERAGISLDT